MNTHVDSHLLRLAESSAASVALEGFFTGVSTDMLSQMISPPETFSAIWTLEHGNWSLRSHDCHSQRLVLGRRCRSWFGHCNCGRHFRHSYRRRNGRGRLLSWSVDIGWRTTSPTERRSWQWRRRRVSRHSLRGYRPLWWRRDNWDHGLLPRNPRSFWSNSYGWSGNYYRRTSGRWRW